MEQLEQIAEQAEPTIFQRAKRWAYQNLAALFIRALEDGKDSRVAAINFLKRTELTPEYIDNLHAQIEADSKAFEEVAEAQYGTDTRKAKQRGMDRLFTRYGGALKRVRAAVTPYIEGGQDPDLPQETRKNLAGLILTYELRVSADRLEHEFSEDSFQFRPAVVQVDQPRVPELEVYTPDAFSLGQAPPLGGYFGDNYINFNRLGDNPFEFKGLDISLKPKDPKYNDPQGE